MTDYDSLINDLTGSFDTAPASPLDDDTQRQ